MGEGNLALHVGEADSDVESGGFTPPPQVDDYIVEAPPLAESCWPIV